MKAPQSGIVSGRLIRPMVEQDLSGALALCRASGWNQIEDDWRCFLSLNGARCWLAETEAGIAGSVAILRYHSSFSWLAMMLVDPSCRRMGIGSQLMDAALTELAGEASVRLDATPAGEPLYRRLGFVPEYSLARLKITVNAKLFHGTPRRVRRMTPSDFASVFEFDRQVFGADRSALLSTFYLRSPGLAWIAEQGSALTGYCFGRPGYHYSQLGPIVGNRDTAYELMAQCFSEQDGASLALDAPQRIIEGFPELEAAGFALERTFLRMGRGEIRHSPRADLEFAIAGPEFG